MRAVENENSRASKSSLCHTIKDGLIFKGIRN